MGSQIDGLKSDMQQILRILADQNKNSIPEASAIIAPQVNSNLEACVQSAGKILSSAASIVYERSVRGSEVGGSVCGDPLTEDKWQRIDAWIPEETIVEEPDEIRPTSLASPSDATISSAASDAIFSSTETTYTGATSPASEYGKFRFDDRTSEAPRIDETNYIVEEETNAFQLSTTPALHTLNVSERKRSTDGVSLSSTPTVNQIKTNSRYRGWPGRRYHGANGRYF